MKKNRILNIILSVCIAAGVIFALDYVISEFFSGESGINSVSGGEVIRFEASEIDEISFSLIASELVFSEGESFGVEVEGDYITYTKSGKKLSVIEKTHSLSLLGTDSKVTVYIPDFVNFSKIDINMGSGEFIADKIKCNNLIFKSGAGEAKIGELLAASSARISSGAGSLTIESGEINNAKLKCGAGEISVKAGIFGKSKLDCGIGELNLTLAGEKDKYMFDVDSSIGEVTLDGEKIGDGKYGSGENTVEIDVGVGEININFE